MSTATLSSTLRDAIVRASQHYNNKALSIRYRNNPELWAKERIQTTLWSKQREICESIVKNKYTAVKSGHSVGKTYLASILAQWWVDTHQGEDAIVVTTAPNFDQVKGILWEYIRKSPGWENEKLERGDNLPGVVSEQAEWKASNRDIIGIGRKPAEGNMTSFQGRHYKYTLVIIDEACGVSKELFDAVDAIVATKTCRVIAIGNPTDPNTHFGTIFLGNGGRGLDAWKKFTISVFDNPNFTGEEVPETITDNVADEGWVQKKREEYGEDSSDWKARVLGEFPESSEDSLFPIHLLYKATENVLDVPTGGRRQLGVDLAMYGSDSSAAVLNVGGVLTIVKTWKDASARQSANFIHNLCIEHEVTDVCIDSGTFGAAIIELVQELAVDQKYMVWAMAGNAKSSDLRKWINARAEWHGHMKEELLGSRIQLPSPVLNTANQQLFNEMQSIKYRINPMRNAMQIESKKEMKDRGVKSPDISDAAMYATARLAHGDPLAHNAPGDVITIDPEELLAEMEYMISPW